MRATHVISAVVAGVAVLVSGAAIPTENSIGLHARQDGGIASPKFFVLNNLSYLFGWQLAGYFTSEDDSHSACNKISSLGHGKWAAIGLNPLFIQEPICNSTHSSPKPKMAFPRSIPYNTGMFTTLLLQSVHGKSKFKYMCDHLGFNMIASFPINDDTVIPAVCSAAGEQAPPQPEANLPMARDEAVAAAKNTASIIFANLLAAGAASDSSLHILCSHAADHVANLNAEGLNGTLVQSTLCNVKQTISIEEARHALRSWTTRYFITVLESISNSRGWLTWLCTHLDAERMNAAGLLGDSVQTQVCADSKL